MADTSTPHQAADMDLLASRVRQGYVGGQVPELIFVHPDSENADQVLVTHQQAIERLIQQGMLGWKCAKKPGRPEVLHTLRPINPATGRELSAFLWMTTLALDTHGDALYAAYSKAEGIKVLSRGEWNDQMRREVIAAPAHLAHLTQPPLPPQKIITPKADPTPNAEGFATRMGPRHSETLVHGGDVGAEDYLKLLDKWNAGPTTLLTRSGYSAGEAEADWFHAAIFAHAGARAVPWMLARGIGMESNNYAHALSYRPGDQDRAVGIRDTWNALLAAGVAPAGPLTQGGTLWHHMVHQWQPPLVQWLKEQGVDWSLPNAHGVLPLALLLQNYVHDQGTQDFYEDGDLFGGTSMKAMLQSMGMAHGLAPTLAAELDHSRQHLAFMEDLVVDMLRSGVSPTAVDNQGRTPLDAIYPEQLHLEKAISDQAGAATPAALRDTVVGTMMFGDMDAMRRSRKAYSANMIRFIEKIEHESGVVILGDEAIPLRRPRR